MRACLLVFAFVLSATAVQAEPAYRFRASIFKSDSIVAFATWVGYEKRTTKVAQAAETPYASRVALAPDKTGSDDVVRTTLELTVLPFQETDGFYLTVDLMFRDVAELNRYRSTGLVEELPTISNYGAGGSFRGQKRDQGWLFDLSLGQDEMKARIEVEPLTPVEQPE